jgi:hypothetical protein
VASLSFDKGFTRTADRELLRRYIPEVVMPKRGKKNAVEAERESGKKFVALLRRHLRQHSPEVVALVTSLPPSALTAAPWLAANRAAWGIGSGLHQRLDVSHRADLCRVRRPKAMRLMGLFRRISHSLFMECRRRQNKPQHKTTTDFFSAMNAEHHRYAIRCLQTRQPSFQTAS